MDCLCFLSHSSVSRHLGSSQCSSSKQCYSEQPSAWIWAHVQLFLYRDIEKGNFMNVKICGFHIWRLPYCPLLHLDLCFPTPWTTITYLLTTRSTLYFISQLSTDGKEVGLELEWDFFSFWPCHTTFGFLVPQPGIKPTPLALEMWSLEPLDH